MECVSDFPYQFHEMNDKVFIPFEINESINTPFTEMDPDIQFYSSTHYALNTRCDYYIEDTFVTNIAEKNQYKNKLSLFHNNVKSLPKHYDELESYINSLNFTFSFIALTENWLDESKQDLYDLQGYSCLHKFRKGKRGGGVSLYIENGIGFTNRSDLEYFDSEMESLFIEAEGSSFNLSSNVIIAVIYRMPNTSLDIFDDRIANIMNTITRENKLCYFLGDLNIDLLKHENHSPTSGFLDTMYSYSMFPLITKPTRVTKDTATLIDHIFTNNFDVDSKHVQGILCTSISDHYAVFHITGNASKSSLSDTEPSLRRNMCHANIVKFRDAMSAVDWREILSMSDAQVAYSSFHKLISDKYNKCFPIRKINKKYFNNKPWLTTALKESIKTKNKLYIDRYKGTNCNEKCKIYKAYRNKLNHLLRSAERKHYQDLLNEHRSNVKKSWQIIKSVINKRKHNPLCTKFKCNDTIITDGNDIANRFNNFFVNIGASLAKKIPVSDKRPSDFMSHDVMEMFYLTPVAEAEVDKIISDFRDSAAGWDELKPSIIKTVKTSIKVPLAHIGNLSFNTGLFPMELKIAKIVPIFKSGEECIFTNYRPVSVLPVFSKIMERLMYDRLISYIIQHKILFAYQFGFQKGKSTHMALITLVDKLTEALDKGDYVIGVFLDFSKAFDTVDHSILLEKMFIYGIRDVALQWFKDYLTGRVQFVTYNGFKSSDGEIKCGVPQGSILGPLLFLIYINDLATVSKACVSILFADDSNVFISGKDVEVMCEKLNNDMENIRQWLCCNKLSLNVSKTHYMVFTPRNKQVENLNIKIQNTNIERVSVTKFLGVMIDAQLSWKCHIEYTCKKISKCLGVILKARKKLNKSVLLNLYYSFAYPYFIYCNHVWGNTYPTNLNKMILLQKKLIRIVTCSPYRAHSKPLLVANNVLSVNEINVYIVGIFMYNYGHDHLPNLFDGFFQRTNEVHDRNTRQSNELHVKFARTDVRKFSLRIHGARIWNNIPMHIKHATSVNVFKQMLKKHLINTNLQGIVTQFWEICLLIDCLMIDI